MLEDSFSSLWNCLFVCLLKRVWVSRGKRVYFSLFIVQVPLRTLTNNDNNSKGNRVKMWNQKQQQTAKLAIENKTIVGFDRTLGSQSAAKQTLGWWGERAVGFARKWSWLGWVWFGLKPIWFLEKRELRTWIVIWLSFPPESSVAPKAWIKQRRRQQQQLQQHFVERLLFEFVCLSMNVGEVEAVIKLVTIRTSLPIILD